MHVNVSRVYITFSNKNRSSSSLKLSASSVGKNTGFNRVQDLPSLHPALVYIKCINSIIVLIMVEL